jgi:hypothetical protein
MNHKHTISCPNCTHQFNADELLYRQIEDNLRQTFSVELADKQKQFDQLTASHKPLKNKSEMKNYF